MFFRSGRTYHSDFLDLESKLDLILKKLQDLKLRVEELENKNKKESSKYDIHDRRENTNNRSVVGVFLIHIVRSILHYGVEGIWIIKSR